MIVLPQLDRIKIRTYFNEIEVQIIKLNRKVHRNVLVFDHLMSRNCLMKLREPIMASQAYALVYEIPDQRSLERSLDSLQGVLKNEEDEYEVGVFHEPFNSFADVYLMIHKEQGLFNETLFKGSRMAIFYFKYKKLLDTDLDNYYLYLGEILKSNCLINRKIESFNNEIRSLQTSIETLNSRMSLLNDKNTRDQSSIVTAKNLVKNLSEELQGNHESHKLDCEMCKQEKKSMLFLPCGDIVNCKNCVKFQLKIPINVAIKKNTYKCQKCRSTIFEVKEVFF